MRGRNGGVAPTVLSFRGGKYQDMTRLGAFAYASGLVVCNLFGAFVKAAGDIFQNDSAGSQAMEVHADGNYYDTTPTPHITRTASQVLRSFSREVRVDVSNLERSTGQAAYNTNAALGSLAAAGPVICQGTSSGSWHLQADTTLTY